MNDTLKTIDALPDGAMNKDEAREVAWKELRTVPLLLEMDEVMNAVCDPRHRNMQMVRLGFGKGFDAGVASVDRKAIVQEAFEVLKHRMSNRPDVGELPRLAMAKEMDAVLASMGGDDAD